MAESIPVKQRKGSPLEICSFVVHFLTFPLGILFILWLMVPDDTLESWNVTYYPPKAWAIHIPTSLLCLFVAAPLLYAACNNLSAPPMNSLDTFRDIHTRTNRVTSTPTGGDANNRGKVATPEQVRLGVPDICDVDPAMLVWYNPATGQPL